MRSALAFPVISSALSLRPAASSFRQVRQSTWDWLGRLGSSIPWPHRLGTGPASKGSLVRVAAGILVDATALSGLGAGPMTAMSTGGQRCLSDGSDER